MPENLEVNFYPTTVGHANDILKSNGYTLAAHVPNAGGQQDAIRAYEEALKERGTKEEYFPDFIVASEAKDDTGWMVYTQ